jgi:hypothetical protein
MSRRNLLILSAAIIVLVAAAFFIGTLYLPYGEGPGVPRPGVSEVPIATPTPTPKLGEALTGYEYGRVEERMVIYTAHISLETRDIDGTLSRIRGLAERYGGYVAGSSKSTYGMQAAAEITIRVPKDAFHRAVQEIEGYGKVLDEGMTSEDVTEEYIDLKARLSSLEAEEERLKEVLDLAGTVEDILAVERELARVRGEIESLQGRIKYLEQSVALSVITVRLVEPPPPFTPPGLNWGEILETALHGFFAVLRGMIILVVSLLPLAIVGVPAYYFYRRRRRKAEAARLESRS